MNTVFKLSIYGILIMPEGQCFVLNMKMKHQNIPITHLRVTVFDYNILQVLFQKYRFLFIR